MDKIRHTAVTALLLLPAAVKAQQFEFYNPDRTERKTGNTVLMARTNLLYDAALCPNIGIELQVGKGLAWQFDYGEAWWNSRPRKKYYSLIFFQTEVRKYFGKKNDETPYRGHHAGVYLQMGMYDLENGGKGHISPELDDNIGFGVSYGYSFRLGKRLSLDCTIGLGVLSSKYQGYLPVGDRFVTTGTNRKTWVGPTKVETSLVWDISKRNRR